MKNSYKNYEKEQLISIIIIVVSLLVFGGFIVYFLVLGGNKDTVKTETMPNIVGYSLNDVEGCYSRFFTLDVEEEYSDYDSGVILSQSIAENESYVPGDTVVKVVVSAGKKPQETAAVTEETTTAATEPERVLETGLIVENPTMEFEYMSQGEALSVSTIGVDKDKEEMSAALDELYRVLVKRGGDAGFLYVDLESGASVEYNADEKFSSGSIIKAPYARAVLGQEKDLEKSFEMTEDMLNSQYELIDDKPVGTEFTIEELVNAAITKSDNTAYKMLYNYVGYDCFNELAETLNLPQQMTDDNYWFRLTARQTAIYFKDIYYFNEEHQNGAFLRKCLENTESNDLFADELTEYEVCEKYGYLPQEDFYTLGDAAVVYADSPYILVAYVRGTGSTLNTQFFHNTARCADNIHKLLHSEN